MKIFKIYRSILRNISHQYNFSKRNHHLEYLPVALIWIVGFFVSVEPFLLIIILDFYFFVVFRVLILSFVSVSLLEEVSF